MGILTKNLPQPTTRTLADALPTPRDAAWDDAAVRAAAFVEQPDPLAAAYALLPPPAPCPTCGSPTLWLDVYRRGWQCPEPATCSPPPIVAVVLARVILVDEGTPATPRPQWARLETCQIQDRGETKWRRQAYTTPIRCTANGNALADALGGDSGDGDGKGRGGDDDGAAVDSQNLTSGPRFFIDETLGRIFHYAEMNGAFGRDARPTGRVFYRDVDGWWGTEIGDWEKIEALDVTSKGAEHGN